MDGKGPGKRKHRTNMSSHFYVHVVGQGAALPPPWSRTAIAVTLFIGVRR